MDRLGPVSPVSGGCLILPCPVASAGEECVWNLFLSWAVEASLEGLLQCEGKVTQTRFWSTFEFCSFPWSGLTRGTEGKALGVCKHGCRTAFSLHIHPPPPRSPPLRAPAVVQRREKQTTTNDVNCEAPTPDFSPEGCLNSGKPYG